MTNAKAYRLAFQEAQRRYPDASGEELDSEVDDILHDWAAEAAHDGGPEDSPCLESCDGGSGEGRYHGCM